MLSGYCYLRPIIDKHQRKEKEHRNYSLRSLAGDNNIQAKIITTMMLNSSSSSLLTTRGAKVIYFQNREYTVISKTESVVQLRCRNRDCTGKAN